MEFGIQREIPEDPEAPLDEAIKLSKEKKFDKAIALVEQSKSLRSYFPQVHDVLAEIYKAAGRKDDAKKEQKHAKITRELRETTIDGIKETMKKEKNPNLKDPRYWYGFGTRQMQFAGITATIPDMALREAIKLDSNFAEAWDALAQVMMIEKRFREAEEAFKKVIKIGKPHSGPLKGLAVCLAIQGKYADAEAYLLKARNLSPSDSSIWHSLGFIQMKNKKPDRAEASLKEALKLSPGNADTLFVQTILHGQSGDDAKMADSAREAFSAAGLDVGEIEILDAPSVESDSLTSDEQTIVSFLGAQGATSEDKAFGPALISLHPFTPEVLHPLRDKGIIGLTAKGGQYLTEEGANLLTGKKQSTVRHTSKPPEIQVQQKVVPAPTSSSQFIRMGIDAFRSSLFPIAALTFKMEIDQNPNNPEGWAWMAMALAGQGMCDESAKFLKQAKKLDSNTPILQEAIEYVSRRCGLSR